MNISQTRASSFFKTFIRHCSLSNNDSQIRDLLPLCCPSSVSSWTASLSGVSRDINGPTSPGTETPPSVLEQENMDLLSRMAELQQEKWNMEEKVGPPPGFACPSDIIKRRSDRLLFRIHSFISCDIT